MEKIITRFGEVEYDPNNLLHFPKGMIGFENLHDFIVMPNKKEGPLFWIQSVDDSNIAFVLTDPSNFFIDYKIEASKEEKDILKVSDKDEVFPLSVVTVPPSKEVTLNLAAPILFAPKTNRAIQVILENSPFNVRTPLPKVEKNKKSDT
jgi:flagellar assembly factor FliW